MEVSKMLKDEVFESRFFKAANLTKPVDATIGGASLETLKSQYGTEKKLVLTFSDHPKRLVVNRTNFDVIAALHGSNTEAWIGKRLQIYAATAFVRGQETPCVRVRRAGGAA